MHFLLGKIGTTEIALCDNQYNSNGSGTDFRMNTSNTNNGGWRDCYMRKTLLNGTSNSLLKALPAALQSAIKSINKYTDAGSGSDHNTAANVIATQDKLWLLSEFEVWGTRYYANEAEKNYQQQYDYFKAGNTKIANRHTAVTTAVWWWLRSPYYRSTNYFCNVNGSGSYDGNNNAYYSAGVRAGFCVSAA